MIYLYVITNRLNGKRYVGVTNNPERRWRQHLRADSYIGSALRKYGCRSFFFDVIGEFSSREMAYEAEKAFIKEHKLKGKAGYNLTEGGGGSPSIRKTSPNYDYLAVKFTTTEGKI